MTAWTEEFSHPDTGYISNGRFGGRVYVNHEGKDDRIECYVHGDQNWKGSWVISSFGSYAGACAYAKKALKNRIEAITKNPDLIWE